MAFCDHCQGQRFDRAQVLRALRATRKQLRTSKQRKLIDDAFALAINAVRSSSWCRTIRSPNWSPAA